MTKVYVPQVPRRRDELTGVFTPTIDVGPATEYGEIELLLPPTASFHAISDLLNILRPKLLHYNFHDGDSIIAIGDPSIMAVVFGLVGQMHGKMYVLKWDRTTRRYVKVRIAL